MTSTLAYGATRDAYETPADTPVNAGLVPCAPVVAATLELLSGSAPA